MVAPVFFLMIFGMIEFGRMIMVQQVLTNASREGARLAVLDDTTASEVTTAVDNYLSAGRVSGADIELVAIDDQTQTEKPFEQSDYGDSIRVSVRVGFDQVSWLPSSFFGNSGRNLAATTIMRRETVQ